jgi:hypothetical protein
VEGPKLLQAWRHSRPAVMALSGVVLVAMLTIFRPPLPSWLPGPVLTAFSAVEGLRDR